MKKRQFRRTLLIVLSVLLLSSNMTFLLVDNLSSVHAAEVGTYADEGSGFVRLKNDYRGQYLYASEGKVAHGTPEETDRASHWLIEAPDGDGKQRIKNRLTGLYMSVENWEGFWSPVELLAISDDLESSQWHVLDAVTNGQSVIRSATDDSHYMHIEDNNGYAQSSSIPPDWGTVQWIIEPVIDYVQFKNSYTNQYLLAAEGKVSYGTPDEADPAAHWIVEEDNGKQRIKNRSTGLYMSVENWEGFWSHVELLAMGGDLATTQWRILDAVTIGAKVIQSVVNDINYLHIQDDNGYAQSSNLPPDWGTAQWFVEDVTVTVPYDPNPGAEGPQVIRIKNDFNGLYLYENQGELLYGNALADDQSSHWLIEEEGDVQRIKNRATGHYISLSGVLSDREAVKVIEAGQSDSTEQWIIQNLNTQGTKLIGNATDTGFYLHVEKKLGFVQFGEIPEQWGSPKWVFITVSDEEPADQMVRFVNSHTDAILYEDEGKVKYGNPDAEDSLSHWLIEDAGEGSKWIKNRETGHYMNNEGLNAGIDPHLNSLNSSAIEPSWSSAKWTVTEGNPGTSVFTSVYQPDQVIHVEDSTGYAQSSSIPPNWGTAQWVLDIVPPAPPIIPTDFIRLKNKEANSYLYENEAGVVLYEVAAEGDARSHWLLQEQAGHYHIVNRATGHVITILGAWDYLRSIDVAASTAANQWHIEASPGDHGIMFRSEERPLDYIHVQDRMGFVQLGLRSIESSALHWLIEDAPTDYFIPELQIDSELVNTGRINDTRQVRLENTHGGVMIGDVNDSVSVLPISGDDPHAIWMLQDENGYKLIHNRGTNRYLGLNNGQLTLNTLSVDEPAPLAALWRSVQRSNHVVLESAAEPNMILQVAANQVDVTLGHVNSPTNAQMFKPTPIREDVVYEAEKAFLAGGAQFGVDTKGFEGAGYAGSFERKGAVAIFSVYADGAGEYDALIRFANGAAVTKQLTLTVNGLDATQLQFPTTSSWDEWAVLHTTLKLRQGINSVAITLEKGDRGNVLLDNMTVLNSVPQLYRGASVNYDLYEAEHAVTNGELISPDRTYQEVASEASGRQAVRLNDVGDYVEFTIDRPANRLTMRYSIPDSEDGKGATSSIGMYVNGEKKPDTFINSDAAWVYGSYPWTNQPADGDAHRFFDESSFVLDDLEAGAVIRIEKESTTTAAYVIVDLIETEWADGPYDKPAGFLSITDYGAVANDDIDDTKAIIKTMAAAQLQGQGVWLPEGVFRVDDGPIEIADITIRGAGKWHTTLMGGGFMGMGSHIRIYDLAMDGEVTTRRDDVSESSFDGTFGVGSTIQHVRIDRAKTGIWVTEKELSDGSTLATDGLYVAGVQIRNTFADGINFSTGTVNSMAEQNQIRNSGDDGMAIWATNKQSINNTYRFNTVELPMLSNNIAVYGGRDINITDNVVSDTVAFGAGINISTRHDPFPTEGTFTVDRNTMYRTGGREYNWPADFGGLFIFAGDKDMKEHILVRDNFIFDSTYQGISFLGEKDIAHIVLENNVVDGTGSWGINASGNVKGSVTFGDTIVRRAGVGAFFNGASGFEFLTKDEGFSYEKHSFRVKLDNQTKAPFTMNEGSSMQALVYAGDEVEPETEVVWSTSDQAIAEVNSDGIVTAKQPGKIKLSAQFAGVARSYSLFVMDQTTPKWPDDATLSSTSNSDGTVTIHWPAVEHNSAIASYRVTVDQGEFEVTDGSATHITLTGLTGGKLYTVQVDARDRSGRWTAESLTIDITPSKVSSGSGSGGGVGPTSTGIIDKIEVMTDENGKSVAEVTVVIERLKAAFDTMATHHDQRLLIDLNVEEAAAVLIIPASLLIDAAGIVPKGIITISHGGATYDLPIEAISSLLTSSPHATLRIAIERIEKSDITAFKSDLYAFNLTVEIDGETVEIYDFGGLYISRTIQFTGDIAWDMATGVVYDEEQKRWRHVPTMFRTFPDGTIEATIRSVTNSLYAVIEEPKTFSDMTSHWATDAVSLLASRKVVNGYDSEHFAPQKEVSRAEFTAMMTEALGLPQHTTHPFKDVHSTSWYDGYVGAATKANIISGFEDNTFRANELITREQMVVMMVRAYRMTGQVQVQSTIDIHAFHDSNSISDWALDDVKTALSLGIIQGRSVEKLAPKDLATRAEAAQMIINMLIKVGFINE